ncbi:hypothetical protein IDZ49_11395, partial [Francisella tularensis]|nr:hypothetical protein [Francisella tularensis]
MSSKGIVHIDAMEELLTGNMLAYTPAIISTIDGVFGDVDRYRITKSLVDLISPKEREDIVRVLRTTPHDQRRKAILSGLYILQAQYCGYVTNE